VSQQWGIMLAPDIIRIISVFTKEKIFRKALTFQERCIKLNIGI
jgi:hypothetical protein